MIGDKHEPAQQQDDTVSDAEVTSPEEAQVEPSAEDKLAAKQQELDELRDQMMRQVAQERNEKEDFIARAKKESEMARRYAVVDMAASLFTIADDMERALAELRKRDDKDSVAGIELIAKNLKEVFAKFDITPVVANVGDAFDPHCHEAVSVRESEHPAGTVLEVMQDGYILGGRVLRPARVIVAKSSDEAGSAKQDADKADKKETKSSKRGE